MTESATEPETESVAGLKTESEKAPEPAQDVRKNEKVCTEKPVAEKPVHKPESLLDAYQDMKNRLEESTLYYPFTRITTEPDGCQYIYESRTLQVKTELFTWGVEDAKSLRTNITSFRTTRLCGLKEWILLSSERRCPVISQKKEMRLKWRKPC